MTASAAELFDAEPGRRGLPVSATIKSRRETHTVEFRLDVTDCPEIGSGSWMRTKHTPIRPFAVNLDYFRTGDRWWVKARVYGKHSTALLSGWADFSSNKTDEWPEWLRALADEHRPS